MSSDKVVKLDKESIYRLDPDSGELVVFQKEAGLKVDELIERVQKNMVDTCLALVEIDQNKYYLLKDYETMEAFAIGELHYSKSGFYELLKVGRFIYDQNQLLGSPHAKRNESLVEYIEDMGKKKTLTMAKAGVSLEALHEGKIILPDGSEMSASEAIQMSVKEFTHKLKEQHKKFQSENEKFFASYELLKAENESYKKHIQIKDAQLKEYEDEFLPNMSNVQRNEKLLARLQELLYDVSKLISQIDIGSNPVDALVQRVFDIHSHMDRAKDELRMNNPYAFGALREGDLEEEL